MSDPEFVPTTVGFPGWTARVGDVVQDFVFHDSRGAGEPVVALYDHLLALTGSPVVINRRAYCFLLLNVNSFVVFHVPGC